MTDAELDRLEALFRNPPSASGLAEHGLALIAELRDVRRGVTIFPPPALTVSRELLDQATVTVTPAIEPEPSAPTPPDRPRSHKKGGK